MNTNRNRVERRLPEMTQLSAGEIAATAGGLQLAAAGTLTGDGEIINPVLPAPNGKLYVATDVGVF
jgi:hypothetical protein